MNLSPILLLRTGKLWNKCHDSQTAEGIGLMNKQKSAKYWKYWTEQDGDEKNHFLPFLLSGPSHFTRE